MASKVTRNSVNTKLCEYLGGPKKLIPSEFPTLRDALQRCLDLQREQIILHDKNRRNISLEEIFSQVAQEILGRWCNSNDEFKEPKVCGLKSIEKRLSRGWTTFNEIARDKASVNTKKQWEPKLDRLFDIAICTCRIVLCGEDDAPCKENCDAKAHCLCNCILNLRLPQKELLWIKAQREKHGSISSMQESLLDAKETVKLRKKNLRESTSEAWLKRQREQAKQVVEITNPTDMTDSYDAGDDTEIDNFEMDNDSESENESTSTKSKGCLKRNYLDISSASVASIRFGVSSTATAAIINGLLNDLVKAGHLGDDKKHLLCDTKKVFRAKDRAIKYSRAEEDAYVAESDIHGVFVDGRKDKTLVLSYDESTSTFRKRSFKENHITVTEEPKGRYLTHYTPEPKTKATKAAKQCAIGLFEWLKDKGIDRSLELIGSDTTNEMSGWKGGMLHHVEELLNRRLFRSFCMLHINELPFRHIVETLDGPTSSDKGWSGAVGKLFSKVETLERKTDFEPIPLLEPLVNISEDILKQMSTDSVVAWKYLHAVVKGELDPEVAALKCGKLSHSRWLTCGMRCLLLYMSKHDLGPKDTEVLKLLATWVTQVYFPMFFEVKVKHYIKYGAGHLIKLFRLWRQQNKKVKNISKPYLISESWWAHPENLLVALLSSNDEKHRDFAVNTIITVRAGSEQGSTTVRSFKVPQTVNVDACDLIELIDWENEIITEPVFTAKMSLRQLNELKLAPMELTKYSLHTQSCERGVKQVTEAAGQVCGWAKRDGFIKAQLRNREEMPSLKSKKDFLNVFET